MQQLTDHSSPENISNPPPTTNPMDDVGDDEEEDVVEDHDINHLVHAIMNNLEIDAQVEALEGKNDTLRSEYELLKNQLESLSSKLEVLEDRSRFLEENIVLAGQIGGLFEPFKLLLAKEWLVQQIKVLHEMRATKKAIIRVGDLQVVNLEKRSMILEYANNNRLRIVRDNSTL